MAQYQILLSALCYSTGAVAIKFAYQEGLGPLTIAGTRLLIAAGILAPVYIRYACQTRAGWKTHLALFVIGTVSITQGLLMLFALQLLSASVATLLLYLYPIFTSVLAFFVLKEKLTPVKTVALAVAITGVFFIVYAPGAVMSSKGVALAVCSAMANSVVLVLIRKMVAGIPPLMCSTGMLTWSGAVIAVISLVLRVPLVSVMTVSRLIPVAVLALVATVLAVTLLNYGLSHAQASLTSIIMTIEPLLTAIWAAMLLREHLTLCQLFGGMLVIGSLLLLTVGDRLVSIVASKNHTELLLL